MAPQLSLGIQSLLFVVLKVVLCGRNLFVRSMVSGSFGKTLEEQVLMASGALACQGELLWRPDGCGDTL